MTQMLISVRCSFYFYAANHSYEIKCLIARIQIHFKFN